MVVREAQQHSNWIDSLMRGVGGDGVRGMISALGNCVVSSAGGIAMLVRIETLTTF
jgi:hypothetical protein